MVFILWNGYKKDDYLTQSPVANQHNSHSSTERQVESPSFLAVLTISASHLSSTASHKLFHRCLICTRILCSEMQFKMPRFSKNFHIFMLNYFSKFILYQKCLWQNTTYLHDKSSGKDMDTSTELNHFNQRNTSASLLKPGTTQGWSFSWGNNTRGEYGRIQTGEEEEVNNAYNDSL